MGLDTEDEDVQVVVASALVDALGEVAWAWVDAWVVAVVASAWVALDEVLDGPQQEVLVEPQQEAEPPLDNECDQHSRHHIDDNCVKEYPHCYQKR